MANKDMRTMEVRNMDVKKTNLLDTLAVLFVRSVKRKKMKILNTNSSLVMALVESKWCWCCRKQLRKQLL